MNITSCIPSDPDEVKRNESKAGTKDQKPPPNEPAALPSSGRVNVGYNQRPSAPPEDKNIHPRRPLPIVPERSPKDQ